MRAINTPHGAIEPNCNLLQCAWNLLPALRCGAVSINGALRIDSPCIAVSSDCDLRQTAGNPIPTLPVGIPPIDLALRIQSPNKPARATGPPFPPVWY